MSKCYVFEQMCPNRYWTVVVRRSRLNILHYYYDIVFKHGLTTFTRGNYIGLNYNYAVLKTDGRFFIFGTFWNNLFLRTDCFWNCIYYSETLIVVRLKLDRKCLTSANHHDPSVLCTACSIYVRTHIAKGTQIRSRRVLNNMTHNDDSVRDQFLNGIKRHNKTFSVILKTKFTTRPIVFYKRPFRNVPRMILRVPSVIKSGKFSTDIDDVSRTLNFSRVPLISNEI